MRSHDLPIRRVLAALLVLATVAVAAPRQDDRAAAPEPRRGWLDRLDKSTRGLLNEMIGLAPPPFSDDLQWVGGEPLTWEDLRGRVVVLQTWTTRTSPGRKWPSRLSAALDAHDGDDVIVIALHTPEGADGAPKFLERQSLDMPVVIDRAGVYCDTIGVFRRPTNIIVDRNGAVRYVGLNVAGVRQTVDLLVQLEADAEAPPPPVFEPDMSPPPSSAFPKFTGTVTTGRDIRGIVAPDFYIQQWWKDQPHLGGKVVVIDFWATWCGPCVASIPHMNELADHFGDRAVFIGLSDETAGKFGEGLDRRSLTPDRFHYALALDPTARMKKDIKIRGIPHAIVMSRDWVVRWQGHPMGLSTAVLEQIIVANEGAPAVGHVGRVRWQKWKD